MMSVSEMAIERRTAFNALREFVEMSGIWGDEITDFLTAMDVADDPVEFVRERAELWKDKLQQSPGSEPKDELAAVTDQAYDQLWIADEEESAKVHSQKMRAPMGKVRRVGARGSQYRFIEIIDEPIEVIRIRLRPSKRAMVLRGRPQYYAIVEFRLSGKDDECSTIIDNRLLVEQLIASEVETRYKLSTQNKGQTVKGTVREIDREEIYSSSYDPEVILNRYELTRPELGFRNYRWESAEIKDQKFDLEQLQKDAELQAQLRRSISHN